MKKILFILFVMTVNLMSYSDVTNEKNTTTNKTIVENFKKYNSLQKSIQNASNLKVDIVNYSETKVYKLRLRPLITTHIALMKGDNPIGYGLGDETNFKFEMLKDKSKTFNLDNIVTITPISENVDTNLIIYTNTGNIYNFYLFSTGIKNNKIPIMNFIITKNGKVDKNKILFKNKYRDRKSLLSEIIRLEKEKSKTFDFNKFDIAKLQFDYILNKHKDKIILVANDLKYTYFRIADNVQIPKIYYFDYNTDTFKTAVSVIYKNTLKVEKISKIWRLDYINDGIFSNGETIIINKISSIYDISEKSKEQYNKTFMSDFTKVKKDYTICNEINVENILIDSIFNDDKFLYLSLNIDNIVPNVYKVVNDLDSPIQSELINNILVIKSTNKRFSLNVGEETICLKIKDD
jgi:type IV secretory pathway VirB9-like protein